MNAVVQPAKRRLIGLLAGVVALFLVSAGLLATNAGLRALTALVSHGGMVSFEGVDGSLLDAPSARTLIINSPDLRITAREISLNWRPAALLGGKIEITRLTAQDVEVLSLPAASPARYPDSLHLPLAMSLQKIEIAELSVYSKAGSAADFSASKLSARLSSDGNRHHLQDLQAQLEYGKLTASGVLNGTRPFTILAQAELSGLADFAGADAQGAHIAATVSGDLMTLAIKAVGSGAGLTGSGEMQLSPYAPFPVAALKIKADGLNPRAFSLTAPEARLTLKADLHGNATGALEGQVTLNNLAPAPLNRNGLPLQDLHAHATLSPRLLQLDDLNLALANNTSITGKLAWQREETTGSAELFIRQLDPSALDTRLRAAKLDGSITLSGDSKAQQGVLSLSDGTLHLDAHLSKSGATITLDKLVLARAQATLTGLGKLQLDGKQAYNFNGSLHRFDLSAFMRSSRSDLNATLDLAGNLAPQATGRLDFMMDNSHLAGQSVSGSGKIEFANSCMTRIDSALRLGDNQLRAMGGLCGKTLQLDLAAPALQQLGAGFGGALDAHASLAGSLARPEVSFEAKGQNLSLPGEHHLATVNAAGSLHGVALNLTVRAADYSIQKKTRMESLQVDVQGSPAQHELNAEITLNKDSKLVLQARGGFPNPAKILQNSQWQGALTELSASGTLPFKLQAKASVSISPNRVVLDTTKLTVAGGTLHINGIDWTPQRLVSQGSFTGIGLRAGLQAEFASSSDKGVLHLGGEWHLDSATQGRLHIMRESGDWILPGEQALGLRTLEFTARAASGQLTAELTAQGTRLGEWHALLSSPFVKSATGYSVPDKAALTGQVNIVISDLAWLGPAISDNIKSGGRLALEAKVAGTLDKPILNGRVHGEDLSLALLDQGLRLQQGKLTANFDRDALRIDTLSFAAPHDPKPKDALLTGVDIGTESGKLTVSGVIGLSGKQGDLTITASRLPLSQRHDRWIIASGSGQIGLKQNQLTLIGNITADAGLISQSAASRPELSDDIVITGRQANVSKGPHLSVEAILNLGDHFYLRTSGLEARLAGQLNVRDTPALRVTGSIAARDATFDAYGQHLTVVRGIVNFQGPLYDPGLNILAVRRGLEVEAGVAVTGTALHPSVKLVSTPTVPDVEKLSWIVLGRAPTGSDSALLLSAAGGILGEGSGGITGKLKQALGMDELSLAQDVSSPAASDNPLSSQIVTVGKRLSSRAFISYSQGVTAVAGVTKLTYTLTPRINIVTQAGMDNAIDVFYIFSFN